MSTLDSLSPPVEDITEMIVREYLSRKGFKDVLAALDIVQPKRETGLNTRKDLSSALRLEKEMKKNREKEQPFSTILEILVEARISQSTKVPSTAPTKNRTKKTLDPLEQPTKQGSSLSSRQLSPSESPLNEIEDFHQPTPKKKKKGTKTSGTEKSKDSPIGLSLSQFDSHEQPPELNEQGKSSTQSVIITEDTMNKPSVRKDRAVRQQNSPRMDSESPKLQNDSLFSHTDKQTSTEVKKAIPAVKKAQRFGENDNVPSIRAKTTDESTRPLRRGVVKRKEDSPTQLTKTSDNIMNMMEDVLSDDDLKGGSSVNRTIKPHPSNERDSHTTPQSHGTATWTRIPPSELVSLHKLLFGANRAKGFAIAWKQGFIFRKSDDGNSYGLIQLEGGPCGIIASVQAEIIAEIKDRSRKIKPGSSAAKGILGRLTNFPSSAQDISTIDFPSPFQKDLLVSALSLILWRARKGDTVFLVRPSSARTRAVENQTDISVMSASFDSTSCSSLDEVMYQIEANLDVYRLDFGVISFVLSLLLSHGLSEIKMEMGMECERGMIDDREYACQELVNLLLVGKAYTHCFDGVRTFDGNTASERVELVGIPTRSRIGFLSIFEFYSQMEVGRNLKLGEAGVWVILYESHYSVLFVGRDGERKVEDLWEEREGKRQNIDFWYYDPLGKQEETIRMSVVPSPPPSTQHVVSPIEQVLSTLLPHSHCIWNGHDPVL
ncbi:putative FAM188B-like protein [Blattamonas nauphoetae]|uniref:Probable ubiquitin carboxyl-terminal hydrolase MINDY-4 n=1 Tax=Blattamonas nauphoetae TaxID=2049346 RepID=A0ABQ9XYY4_9EUKA|nr:putative FAM188B-like protein [Blattamonas nauphoetae]